MKGLLLKDIYTLTKQLGAILLLVVFFTFMENMAAFAVVYMALLPITALAYDERSKWDSLAAMMPYSPRDLVLSKYLLGYIGIAFSTVVSLLVRFILARVKGGVFGAEELVTILLTACVAVFMLSINLPAIFRLGVEKGRVVFYVLMAATIFIGMLGSQWLTNTISLEAISPLPLVGGVVLLTAAVNLLSIRLSVSCYRRRAA